MPKYRFTFTNREEHTFTASRIDKDAHDTQLTAIGEQDQVVFVTAVADVQNLVELADDADDAD